MESIGWKLGKTSGSYVRSGFQAGKPGFGMMSAEAAESLYLASLQAQKNEIERIRSSYGGYFSVGFAIFLSDRIAELDKLMETDRQPNNIQGKES
jgi:hypothetical protein